MQKKCRYRVNPHLRGPKMDRTTAAAAVVTTVSTVYGHAEDDTSYHRLTRILMHHLLFMENHNSSVFVLL